MPSLLETLASKEFLRKAWLSINKSNKYSRGLTNISILKFSDQLDTNLTQISKELLENRYNFSKVRAVAIAKSNSTELRPLRIAEIRDRVVQKALAIIIEEKTSETFQLNNECSFAYIKGKNVENAVTKMTEYYQAGYKYILEADIVKFFDNVNKEKLLEKVYEVLPDTSINGILATALMQEIGNKNDFAEDVYEKYFYNTENGIPQGNSLSPLLANIYLSEFDEQVIKAGYKMIRYADDFIIMCKSYDDASKSLDFAKTILEENLHLKVHDIGDATNEDAKTKISNPAMHKFSFLSIRFDGSRCWVKQKKYESIIEKIKTITDINALKDTKQFTGLLDLLKSLRNTIEGWVAAYHFVDLSTQLPEIDKHINRQLYLALLELEFPIEKKSLEKIIFKGKTHEIWALSNTQRLNIGIPSSKRTWEKMKKTKIEKEQFLNQPLKKITTPSLS